MKVHRPLADACREILTSVFKEGKVLDRVLEEAFSNNSRWGKRDRSFIAETVFEVVRWKRSLEFVADAASNEALCAAQWRRAGLEIPEWWKWTGCSVEEMASREGDLAAQSRAVRESIPDWLDERGSLELGERWDIELAALNRRAPVFLRVNRLRVKVDEAIGWLGDHGVTASRVDGVEDALVLPEGKMLPKSLLAEGLVEIQDAGSQLVAPLLGVEPGMKVLDACAGSGGKTLHLSALMEGKGKIIAMDVSEGKLAALQRRAARAGARNIHPSLWREDSLKNLAGWADRVLIDAPCSGLGTLRRQPDLKWRLTPKTLEKTLKLQKSLIANYPQAARPGGKFVYATCSILPSENAGQLEGLKVRSEVSCMPSERGFDGFYAGRVGV